MVESGGGGGGQEATPQPAGVTMLQELLLCHILPASDPRAIPEGAGPLALV